MDEELEEVQVLGEVEQQQSRSRRRTYCRICRFVFHLLGCFPDTGSNLGRTLASWSFEVVLPDQAMVVLYDGERRERARS